jgi:WD40-like Beta Propeller Repeat
VLFGPEPGPIPSDFCLVRGETSRPIWFAGKAPTNEQMTWLPDSKRILVKNKAGRLYFVTLEGNDEQRFQATDYEALRFAFSSTTGAIALSENSPTSVLQTKIYELESGELLARILGLGAGAWSPDGRFLAGGQSNERENWVAVIDTQNPAADPVEALNVRGTRNYYLEGWSSRNDWLTITRGTETGIKVVVVEWPSGEVIRLHEFMGCQENSSWSPVASEIAYKGNPNEDWELFVETPGMNEARNITQSAGIHEDQPDWSPDGRYIVYVTITPPGDRQRYRQELRVIEVETGEVLQLTNTPDEYEALPKWSPDGTRIAYLSSQGEELYLYTIEPTGENSTQVVQVPAE